MQPLASLLPTTPHYGVQPLVCTTMCEYKLCTTMCNGAMVLAGVRPGTILGYREVGGTQAASIGTQPSPKAIAKFAPFLFICLSRKFGFAK